MLDKVRKVERVFKQLDKETEKFAHQSGLKCLTNCNLCCLKKNLEASVLEFLPYAYHLVINNQHEAVLNFLDTEPDLCVNLAKYQAPGTISGCSAYENRGLICRLFGFSAVRDKNAKLAILTCSHIKNQFPEEYKKSSVRINGNLHIPVASDFYSKLQNIDLQLANDYNPINVSIRKAIERVAYYYAYKPQRRTRKRRNPQTENEI